MKRILLIIVIIFYSLLSFSQYYDSGQDSYKVKWKQIKTSTHKIIFPADMEAKARVYAAYLTLISQHANKTMSVKPKQIPALIHSNTVISNGEVAWAPKRISLFAISPQDNNNQLWEQHLLTHEYRHTLQLSKLNNGFTRFLSVILGEQAVGLVVGLHVPKWFLEGDAVVYETASGLAGRGRNPDFTMPIKAQLVDKKIYSYPKAEFGSYKHFVPDHYALGYQLVAFGREHYGANIWNSTMDKVGKFSFFVNPFSFGIRRATKMPERKFYKCAFTSLQNKFKEQQDTTKQDYITLTKKKKFDFVNYYNPKSYRNGVVAIKTSYNHIPKFVYIDSTGNEKSILSMGYLTDNQYSLSQDFLVWNEKTTSRWEHDNYNNIMLYNLKTKQRTKLTKKQRIFSSSLSPNAKQIVSVEVNKAINWSITIRNTDDGKLLQTFIFDTIQPMYPEWLQNQQKIVFTAVGKGGKALGILDINSKKIKWILQNEQLILSKPQCISNSIIVKGVYNSTTNFFKYNLENETWSLLTNVKYGVGECCVANDSLLFSNYTADGYCLQKKSLNSVKNKTKPQQVHSVLLDTLCKQEQKINFNNADTTNLLVEDYNRGANLLNFHSWAPLAIDANQGSATMGVSAMSQNVTNTSFLTLGMRHNPFKKNNTFYFDFQYKGFYPVFHFNASYLPEKITKQRRKIQAHIPQIYTGLEVPFKTNYRAWQVGVSPFVFYSLDAIYFNRNSYYRNIAMHSLMYGISTYNIRKTSYRQIVPNWGQMLYFYYKHTPFKNDAHQFLARAKLYFPGALHNQSLYFTGTYQQQHSEVFDYVGDKTTARGYALYDNDEKYILTANYTMPLLYPDLNIFQFLYIKRIWTNVFYDYSKLYYKEYNMTLSSVGAEVLFNIHLFRLMVPMQFGIRYARKLETNENYFYPMFKMNFGAI